MKKEDHPVMPYDIQCNICDGKLEQTKMVFYSAQPQYVHKCTECKSEFWSEFQIDKSPELKRALEQLETYQKIDEILGFV